MEHDLRAALIRQRRVRDVRALLLVAPAFLFILAGFIVPIALTLYKAIDNSELSRALPHVHDAIRQWDGKGLPDERAYAALAQDLKSAFAERTLGIPGRRLNLEIPGFVNLLQSTGRKLTDEGEPVAPYKAQLEQIDRRWAEPRYWQAIRRAASTWTDFYFLAAFDLKRDAGDAIVAVPDDQRLYLDVLQRSVWVSLCVTALCLLVAYPISFTMSTLSPGLANIALMLVLLPFWTSVLVRTSAWFVLLQKEGLINGTLLAMGLISKPESLMFNRAGVIIALSHVLLPYMVLTLYAVMKGIDPQYVRSASSLGANPWQAFRRVYLPQILPGVAAGCLLVFILALGSYVTPALVGGRHDQMIAYFIAFNVNQTVNWGLASALSTLLLAVVLSLYPLYGRFAGVNRAGAA
jgi:putative spermidine/putrescine transport system permease protein